MKKPAIVTVAGKKMYVYEKILFSDHAFHRDDGNE